MRIVKTIIADDHRMLRRALSIFLKKLDYIQIIGEAENGKEVVEYCEKQIINLVIMDIGMPVMDGWETTKIITKKFPFTKILINSMFTQEANIKKMFMAGANGYISKNCSEDEFIKAVEVVSRGGKYISSELQESFINNVLKDENETSPLFQLTNREKEVVKLILDGLSSKEIAEKLFLSLKTVECHRSNIYKRLKVKNVIELMKTYKHKFII